MPEVCTLTPVYHDSGTVSATTSVGGAGPYAGGDVLLFEGPALAAGVEYRYYAWNNVATAVKNGVLQSVVLWVTVAVGSPLGRHQVQVTLAGPASDVYTNLQVGMQEMQQTVELEEVCTGVPSGQGRPGQDGTDPGYHVTLTQWRGAVADPMPLYRTGQRVDITFADFGWTARPFLVTRVRTLRTGKLHKIVVELDKLPGTGSQTGTSSYFTVGGTAAQGVGSAAVLRAA